MKSIVVKMEYKMPNNARLTDMWSGVCICHQKDISMTGPIITASPNRFVNGLGQARLTDITIGTCGHTGVIITASPNAFTNGLGNARLGDVVIGCNVGIIITASPDTFTN